MASDSDFSPADQSDDWNSWEHDAEPREPARGTPSSNGDDGTLDEPSRRPPTSVEEGRSVSEDRPRSAPVLREGSYDNEGPHCPVRSTRNGCYVYGDPRHHMQFTSNGKLLHALDLCLPGSSTTAGSLQSQMADPALASNRGGEEERTPDFMVHRPRPIFSLPTFPSVLDPQLPSFQGPSGLSTNEGINFLNSERYGPRPNLPSALPFNPREFVPLNRPTCPRPIFSLPTFPSVLDPQLPSFQGRSGLSTNEGINFINSDRYGPRPNLPSALPFNPREFVPFNRPTRPGGAIPPLSSVPDEQIVVLQNDAGTLISMRISGGNFVVSTSGPAPYNLPRTNDVRPQHHHFQHTAPNMPQYSSLGTEHGQRGPSLTPRHPVNAAENVVDNTSITNGRQLQHYLNGWEEKLVNFKDTITDILNNRLGREERYPTSAHPVNITQKAAVPQGDGSHRAARIRRPRRLGRASQEADSSPRLFNLHGNRPLPQVPLPSFFKPARCVPRTSTSDAARGGIPSVMRQQFKKQPRKRRMLVTLEDLATALSAVMKRRRRKVKIPAASTSSTPKLPGNNSHPSTSTAFLPQTRVQNQTSSTVSSRECRPSSATVPETSTVPILTFIPNSLAISNSNLSIATPIPASKRHVSNATIPIHTTSTSAAPKRRASTRTTNTTSISSNSLTAEAQGAPDAHPQNAMSKSDKVETHSSAPTVILISSDEETESPPKTRNQEDAWISIVKNLNLPSSYPPPDALLIIPSNSFHPSSRTNIYLPSTSASAADSMPSSGHLVVTPSTDDASNAATHELPSLANVPLPPGEERKREEREQ